MKIIHRAKLMSENGDVSPLCAVKPRKIDLSKASWTLIDKMVTCPRCKKRAREAEKHE